MFFFDTIPAIVYSNANQIKCPTMTRRIIWRKIGSCFVTFPSNVSIAKVIIIKSGRIGIIIRWIRTKTTLLNSSVIFSRS